MTKLRKSIQCVHDAPC